MMIKIYYKSSLMFCFVFLFFGKPYGHTQNLPPFAEPGKCYAKSLIVDVMEKVEVCYPIYFGGDSLASNSNLEKIVVDPGGAAGYWQKKKDIFSGSFVYCYVEGEKEIEELVIVIDTSITKDYVFECFTEEELVEKGGYTEWQEVICAKKVDVDFINDLQQALISEYFLAELEDTNVISVNIKSALTSYQKFNNLPVGQLDVKTLEKLEVAYW